MKTAHLGTSLALGSGLLAANPEAVQAAVDWQAIAGWLALGLSVGLALVALVLVKLWKRIGELRTALSRAEEYAWTAEQTGEQRVALLRNELKEMREVIDGYQQRWQQHLEAWSELQDRFHLVELHAGACVPARPISSGMNINKHVEVLRLAGEGWEEFEIAEELSIPVGEVRLLLHLDRNQPQPQPVRKRARRILGNDVSN